MSEARDRLLAAIKDCDAEIFGERPSDQMLTNYVVVYSHRCMADDPEDDSDALSRLTMPGQSVWQTLGLIDAQRVYLHALLTADAE